MRVLSDNGMTEDQKVAVSRGSWENGFPRTEPESSGHELEDGSWLLYDFEGWDEAIEVIVAIVAAG
jgi:hypothetical protein